MEKFEKELLEYYLNRNNTKISKQNHTGKTRLVGVHARVEYHIEGLVLEIPEHWFSSLEVGKEYVISDLISSGNYET